MSSANLPRPRSRRFSSLRGSDLPTQPSAWLFLVALTAWSSWSIRFSAGVPPAVRSILPSALSLECGYFSAARSPSISFCTFFLPSGSNSPPAMDARPPKICASPCQATFVPAPAANRSKPAVSARQLHLHVGRSPDIGDANVHLHREMSCILPRHALEIGEQRSEFLRVSQEIVYLFRRAFSFKLAVKLDRHASDSLHALRRQVDRLQNILISSAAAGVAGDRPAHFLFAGLLILREQLVCGKHQPWRAVSTLQSVSVAERFLDGMKLAIFLQPLHRDDFRAVRLHREYRTRLHRGAVHQHGTGAAIGRVTAHVGSGEVELLANQFH